MSEQTIDERRLAMAEDTTKVKKSTKQRSMRRLNAYLGRKAENIEANGNPNRAESFRAFWTPIVTPDQIREPSE
jgi:hypothetical protein